MVKNYVDYAIKCQTYQFYANLIHQSPEPLYLKISSWPFNARDLM